MSNSMTETTPGTLEGEIESMGERNGAGSGSSFAI